MTEQYPLVSKGVKEFTRDGLVLLIDPDRPAWALVNRLGAQIAKLCDGKRSVERIVDSLAANYAVSRDVLTRDVNAFVAVLEKSALLQYGEPAPIEHRNLADQMQPIRSACFELTERCNLRCKHCFEEAGALTNQDPSTAEVMSWLDKFAAVPGITINLSGGEMLTRRDWRELVSHLAGLKVSSVILTNGTLVTNEVAKELAELTADAPFTFQVSLDGSDPQTNDPVRGEGSFERILAGIGALSAQGLSSHTAISFTPNRINIPKLDEMLNLALSLGVGVFHISILHRMGRATGIWRKLKPTTAQMIEFFDTLHDRSGELEGRLRISGDFCSMLNDKVKRIPSPASVGCRLGVDVKVDVRGDVYPCPPMSYDKKYCIGNIGAQTVEQIQNSPVLHELRELFVPRIEQSPRCRTCAWKCFCGAGCIARAEQNYGTIYHGDDLCGLAKEQYERTFFRLAEGRRSAAHAEAS